MKGVLAILKGRLVIVILSVLILAMIPTGWFISSKLNAKIKEQQSKAYQEEKGKISRASKVTYTLPRISESESEDALSVTRAPNDAVTEWFAQQRAMREQQLKAIEDRVVTLNEDGHGRLVEAFPPDDDADPRTKRRSVRTLAGAITGTGRGYDRSIYEDLLADLGAGSPPDRAEVAQVVDEFQQRELDLLTSRAGADGAVTSDQRDELAKRLVDRRIGEYRRVARDFSFYGDLSALTGEVEDKGGRFGRSTKSSFGEYSQIPTAIPEDRASVVEGYIWQWDYWVIEDILRAIANANTDAAGDPTPVELSVVKRIESIRLDKFEIAESDSESPDMTAAGNFGGAFGSAGIDTDSSGIPGRASFTGRKRSTNSYDTRQATLVAIVAPGRIVKLLDAIKATNLMTVTDVDLEEIDPWSDLAQGYFYGDEEYVMRATIGVESVWLRKWTRKYMPAEVRKALGIADTPKESDDEG